MNEIPNKTVIVKASKKSERSSSIKAWCAQVAVDPESNKIIYPENVVKFAESSPKGIASAINSLIQNDSERKLIIKTAYNWVSNTSWEKSFNKVEKFIKEEVLSLIHI